MAVDVTYRSVLTTVETLSTNVPAAPSASRTITQSGFSTEQSLTALTTPPATACCYTVAALITGALTVDLRSLTGTNGVPIDLNGLKVQCLKLRAKQSNGAAVTAAKGATNGYELAGAAWSVTLAPGQEVLFYGNDATPDVGATAKTIDLSGAGTDALEVSIVAG